MKKQRRTLKFQQEAVDEIIYNIRQKDKKHIYFQAPTGSGKTLMTSMFIEEIVKLPELLNQKINFLFIAPSSGSIDYQGYDKITKYLKEEWVKGFKTEYIGTSGGSTKKSQYLNNIDYFEENTVYFMGWGIIKKGSNALKIDSEKNDLFRVIQNTKEKGIHTILIIDEAHREYKTERKEEALRGRFLNKIDPIKTIEISATLDTNDDDAIKVTLDRVREEETIKKNVFINEDDLTKEKIDNTTIIESLIKKSIKKQQEITDAYRRVNIKGIKPLILIQIPDTGTVKTPEGEKIEDYYLHQIEEIFKELELKEKRDYAIWLDKNKTFKNQKEITDNNSPIKCLIFKQAIATGWDVPRASILVKLRNPKNGSSKFEIQTLGRILRNPFFKYYEGKRGVSIEDAQCIDNAFVYTSDADYAERMKQTDYSSNPKEFKKADLSFKGLKNKIKIYKNILENKDVSFLEKDYENIINIIKDKEINEIVKDLINFKENKIYEKEINDIIKSDIIRSTDIIGGEYKYRNMGEEQKSWAFNAGKQFKENMMDIYVRYLSTINSNYIYDSIIKIMYKLSKNINENITLKLIYKFVILRYNKSVIDSKTTLKEYIDSLINKIIKEKSSYTLEEFENKNTFKYDTGKFTDAWDEVNAYKISLKEKALDSTGEIIFYDKIQQWGYDNEDFIIYRNGINPNTSYYSEYFDSSTNKVSRFYPDFLLVNKTQILIVEIKGRNKNDIDNNTNQKINCLLKNNLTVEKEVIVSKLQFGKNIKNFDDLELVIYEDKLNYNVCDNTKNYLLEFIKN